jgi:hypothetical protein
MVDLNPFDGDGIDLGFSPKDVAKSVGGFLYEATPLDNIVNIGKAVGQGLGGGGWRWGDIGRNLAGGAFDIGAMYLGGGAGRASMLTRQLKPTKRLGGSWANSPSRVLQGAASAKNAFISPIPMVREAGRWPFARARYGWTAPLASTEKSKFLNLAAGVGGAMYGAQRMPENIVDVRDTAQLVVDLANKPLGTNWSVPNTPEFIQNLAEGRGFNENVAYAQNFGQTGTYQEEPVEAGSGLAPGMGGTKQSPIRQEEPVEGGSGLVPGVGGTGPSTGGGATGPSTGSAGTTPPDAGTGLALSPDQQAALDQARIDALRQLNLQLAESDLRRRGGSQAFQEALRSAGRFGAGSAANLRAIASEMGFGASPAIVGGGLADIAREEARRRMAAQAEYRSLQEQIARAGSSAQLTYEQMLNDIAMQEAAARAAGAAQNVTGRYGV